MAKLFGIDIPKLLNQSMPGMLAGILTVSTVGTRTNGNPAAGTNPTAASFAFRGFASTYVQKAYEQIRNAQHTVLIMADSCKNAGVAVEPKPGDTIVLTGDPQLAGKTLVIIDDGVKRDPASATWTCYVRTLGA